MRAHLKRRAGTRLAIVLAALALGLPAVDHGTRPAYADTTSAVDDRSVAVPTGWKVYTGVTPSQITNTVLAGGYRLTEIHADQPVNPTTFTVRAVRNLGPYAPPGWWWYYGQTLAQVSTLLSNNNARLVSLDGYNTSNGARYAVVMVSNTGAYAKSWHWWVSTSVSSISSKLSQYGDRIVDLGEFMVGSTRYYTAVTVKNSGDDAKGWYWYVNRTTAQVSSLLSTNNARLVDIEAAGNGLWDVVMQTDQQGFWVWYVGQTTPAKLVSIANQTGTRLISVQRYVVSGTTYFAGVFLNNLAAPSSTMRDILWPKLGTFNSWGFYSKRVGGSTATALQTGVRFEPASAIKVVHHLYVHMRMQNNSIDLNGTIKYPYRSGDSANGNICPKVDDPLASTSVANADNKMMTISDNRMTRAIRDAYGYSNILAVANIVGMSSTSFPNTLGCLTYGGYNLTTLTDLGRLYESVAAGTSISGTARDHFYANMGSSKTAFCNVASTEGASLGKSSGTIAAFCDAIRQSSKGGSYTLNLSDGRHIWRSSFGRLSLPVKSGDTITPHEYVYGDYLHDVKATSAQESAISTARASALAEQFRAQIRAALQTW